jgi:hypothetical protein
MSPPQKTKTTQELMAEADELVKHIHSDVIMDLKEEHRIEFEKHAKELKRIKSMADSKESTDQNHDRHSAAEGIHEAILDIVKAMQDWKNKIF